MSFTHLDDSGRARMVDVTAKAPTVRAATARGFVRCSPDVVASLRDSTVPKGDVLAVARLSSDILLVPSDTDGVCLADASSRPQWLTGAYRTAALRRAAGALPDAGRDASVRALLDDLAIAAIAAPDDLTADVDTWEDLDRARAAAGDSPLEDS